VARELKPMFILKALKNELAKEEPDHERVGQMVMDAYNEGANPMQLLFDKYNIETKEREEA
jgi:hypothetical protein